MPKKQETELLTWLEEFSRALRNQEKISSDTLTLAIGDLQRKQKIARQRERLEQRRLERMRREQEAREAKEREEAHIQEVTSMELPLDWENLFAGDSRTEGVRAECISDGLILSLTTLGRVDIEYIAEVTGQELKAVILALKGSIYQNPETWEECFYKGWETAEEYLSGNVVAKWRSARAANDKYHGYFGDNVRALAEVLPNGLASGDIYVTLGSPWVPADVIDQFITWLFGNTTLYTGTRHDETTGSWEIPQKGLFSFRSQSWSEYGTERIHALNILEHTLNMKTVSVTDEVKSAATKSGYKRVVNQAETLAALEKQKKLIRAFQDWVWTETGRKNRLETIFESKYCASRKRRFDGSFLTFPTMSPEVRLYPYQKNAVARILFTPNTLLAHDVGSGKTYIMAAAGMELRRVGLAKKNLYVVPNNLVGQWRSIFLTLYPQAKLLCVEPKSFTPQKRNKVLESIRDEDFDGIIMAYSCFDMIPLSQDYYTRQWEELRQKLSQLLQQNDKATATLRRYSEKTEKSVKDLLKRVQQEELIPFDKLGIDRLFVDEAHNYKNVPVETKVTRALGISSAGSQKCADMLEKVHFVQKTGGGVILATGTPITNSITDAYVMQTYLQSGELALLDLQHFDSWVGMFAERVTEFEVDVDTSTYRLATRFSRFHNLPELTNILASVADFHQTGQENGVPETDGYTDVLIPRTAEFTTFLGQISKRADDVRKGRVNRKQDNMLLITTDGRKAALDLRLLNPNAPFSYQTKVMNCAETVWRIYHRTYAQRSTQLVFCDTSIPKVGFNLYDELRRLLVGMGIPEGEIAYVHSAETERAREKLFSQVRSGQVRILMGSTFKLGLGVNVQDKLIAVHHLDIPWRPADMVQREGRILRQGNENPKVEIYRYVTEDSFDAYSWQLLESKQRFISELLSGSMDQRSGKDIQDTVLDYAEVKALAVGDPMIKVRVETANELTRLLTLQRKLTSDRERLSREAEELPEQILRQQEKIHACELDQSWGDAVQVTEDKETRRSLRKTIFDAVLANVLQPETRTLMEYHGFRLELPANVLKEEPFLWLVREGRYYVELGDSEVGCLIRIDNAIAGLGDRKKKMQEGLADLEARLAAVQAELRKDENYSDQITAVQDQLRRIDEQLGVTQ